MQTSWRRNRIWPMKPRIFPDVSFNRQRSNFRRFVFPSGKTFRQLQLSIDKVAEKLTVDQHDAVVGARALLVLGAAADGVDGVGGPGGAVGGGFVLLDPQAGAAHFGQAESCVSSSFVFVPKNCHCLSLFLPFLQCFFFHKITSASQFSPR